MIARAIPPGFASREEALDRATEKWGRRDAMAKLRGLMSVAELHGWDGESQRQAPSQLPSSFWSTRDSWGVIEGERTYLPPGRRQYHLLFKQVDLDRVFPVAEDGPESKDVGKASGQIPDRSAATSALKKPSGRPPNANADDFWIEAARMVYNREQGDAGQTQREFIDAMLKWSERKMNDPYKEDTIKSKIEGLWRRLKLGNQRG